MKGEGGKIDSLDAWPSKLKFLRSTVFSMHVSGMDLSATRLKGNFVFCSIKKKGAVIQR